MSVNTLPNLCKFSFYYSPLFIFIFILLLYILKAHDFKTWGGSFFIMIGLFVIPYMFYMLIAIKQIPDFKNPHALFTNIPFASTFILLFCIASYSMTMGMMNVINNKYKAKTKTKNNEKDCMDRPNAFILILFILLLINDIFRHYKLQFNVNIPSLVYIALISFSILPPVLTYFLIGITANEKNNNSNLLFIKTYSNTICSNNHIAGEFYCRNVDNNTSTISH